MVVLTATSDAAVAEAPAASEAIGGGGEKRKHDQR